MAYDRFWNSDIYIYPHVSGYIQCYGSCGGTIIRDDYSLIYHIQEHRDNNENIPESLLQEILLDIDRYRPHIEPIEPREN